MFLLKVKTKTTGLHIFEWNYDNLADAWEFLIKELDLPTERDFKENVKELELFDENGKLIAHYKGGKWEEIK